MAIMKTTKRRAQYIEKLPRKCKLLGNDIAVNQDTENAFFTFALSKT
jgi:hypothetical protein